MKIAFVGIKRKYQELPSEYRDMFDKHHLELPFYYARDGKNNVTITTVDDEQIFGTEFDGGGLLCRTTEEKFKVEPREYDVVIHWRKWFPELYKPGALNLINCQDHSFSPEWKSSVTNAMNAGQLYGILCFPTWHKRNLHDETNIPMERLLDGVTLGVDTDIYKPSEDKDPYQMLWSSDPGRGLDGAIGFAIRLFQYDKRFRLHICYPDYVKQPFHAQHPSLVWHGNKQNGQTLWNLFNTTGILPYTSTFKEPSSRAHRQAQAAGSLVLYPPGMGSPSELILDNVTGIVAPMMPVNTWIDRILGLVKSGEWKEIGKRAREFAVSQNWQVQSDNFNKLVHGIIQGR